jgi:PAS domain S-box-containing protein
LTSLYNYLLFHSFAEIFSIVVACGIFMVAWNSRQFLDKNYLLFVGIAFLFIATLDLIHTLAYTGMNIFYGYKSNLPTQLWIAARYLEGISLLVAPLFFSRKLKPNFVFLGYAVVTTLLLLSIFYWDIFPICFLEGVGLTPFKKVSEYIICLILLASIALLVRNRKEFDKNVLQWMIGSIIVTIFSELAFTSYVQAYGFSNLLGHFFKIVSFYLIYKAIIETGLTRPYALLFRNLKQSEERFRNIFEKSPIGIELYDSVGQLVDANKACLEIFGVSDNEKMKGFKLFEDPNLSEEVKENLKGGEVFRYEAPFDFQKVKEHKLYETTKSGVSYLNVSITPLGAWQKEDKSGYLGQVQDITEHKRMEEALRRSREELEHRIRERTVELSKANEELRAEITERKRTEEALRKLTYDLNERIKEINCLYSISYYVGKQYGFLDEKLQNIVDLIPSGWQYPETACARIVLEDKEYKTGNFKETPWKQASDIMLHDEKIGNIEIYYLEEKPMIAEGPFLKEERRLINSIAIELGEMMGHRRAEKALREQSRILEAFFTSTITPLVFLDKDFNFVRVNQAYAKACQREISEFPGHNHFEFYPSDAKGIFEQVVQTKEAYQAVARPFAFPDHPEWGITHWDWNLTPILDQKGEVEFLVFSLNDVTERKRAEKAVRAERQRFNDVLEILPAYLVLLTPDYHVPFANLFFRERFGESHGQRCFEYLFGRSEPCEICETYTVLKTNAPHHWEWTGPDGRIYDIYDFPFTDTDGSPLIMEMGIDITERKKAEEALQAASAYTRNLIEASLDPLVTISADGKIMDVNSATELTTGVPRNELIGTDFSDYFMEPEKAREGYQRVFREGFVRDYPLAIRHTSGKVTDVLYHATVFRNETGVSQGVFAAARDITERKEIEKRTHATNILLELFSKKAVRKEYLDAVVDLLRSWSECRCVGIRVQDKQGFIPYESYLGFGKEFWESENWLSVRQNQCVCIRIITGNPDSQDASMTTPYGSFHCGNTFKFIGQLSEEEKTRFRGVCLQNGFSSVSIVPIRYRGEVLGAIHLADEREGQVPLKAMEFIESVAPLIGEALHRFDLEEEIRESENRLRYLSSQLLTIQENERKRISREIHDSLGQSLSAIKFRVESILQELRGSRQKTTAQSLENVIPIVQQSIEEARRIQMDLRPSILDDLGILSTISWFCREFQTTYKGIGIEAQVDIKEDEVPDSLKTAIYRIMQEALNNIAKHSGAELVRLFLTRTDNKIELQIQDNGMGFDIEENLSLQRSRRGLGLTSMRERAELSGGSFVIESIKGKGTTIRANWPI